MKLTSSAFEDGEPIPRLHTYEGRRDSPALAWSEVPEGTAEFALIVEDPDAPVGTFTHWVVYRIPGDRRELPQGMPHEQEVLDGTIQGKNDFGKTGYGAPYPPPGDEHRYVFRLFALDTTLDIGSRPTRDALARAMDGHVLSQAELVGTCQRSE